MLGSDPWGERWRFAAIVTAAGASTRMGAPKALATWRGVPLLLHQARVLAAAGAKGPVGAVAEILAVVGADAALIRREAETWDAPAELRLIDNPRWEEGRSVSLEVGVAALRRPPTEGVFVLAVDQPLDPAVVGALVAASTPGDEVLLPVHGGRRGHPVLWPASRLDELARASAYPEGLRDLVRASRVREVPVASPSIHLDLNTPDSLRRAQDEPPSR